MKPVMQKMPKIDELAGRELADAVCDARGLKLLGRQPTYSAYAHPDGNPAHQIIVRCDEPLDPDYHPSGYRPDRDVAQVWELEGDGWLWESSENMNGLVVRVRVPNTHRWAYGAWVDWADFPNKANAYATARCRAFLKAKEAMG